MSLNDMVQRMILEIPGLSSPYARTLLNEALGFIEDMQMWSFQLQTAGWLTPGLLFPAGPGNSVGTVTVTPNSNQVIGDAVASAAWAAYNGAGNLPLLTQLQFRSPFYSLYNIIAYDTTSNPPYGTFTLDRPWMEPGGAGQAYMVYEAYFPVGDPNFKRFLSARNTTNNWAMDYFTLSQKDLAVLDPERTIFDDPVYIVPYQIDQRPNSATLGQLLVELWPGPLSILPYTYQYLTRGPQLQQPSDTVPAPITEEVVLWKAKAAGYLWAEAQKGVAVQRGSGADFRFLAQSADAEFAQKLKPIKDRDRDLAELYWSRLQRSYPVNSQGYATESGQLNIGNL